MIVYEGKAYRGISREGSMFRFRYTDAEGREHRVKCRTLDEALELYHRKKKEAHDGKKLPAPERGLRRAKFCQLADSALAHSENRKRSYRTDIPRIVKLKELFGDCIAEALTPREIEEKLNRVAEQEGWAPSTFNHYRSLISLAYRLAIRNGAVGVNPASSVPHRREDNSRVRYLTQDEEQRLRKVVIEKWPQHVPELDLALHTGLRQGNQYGLTWDMVDWSARMLHIPRTKNEESLHVPLNNAALAALEAVRTRANGSGRVFISERTGEPLEHPRHWFDRAVREAGISDLRWHDLRHTFASRLRMHGVPLETIADLLGHKGLTMAKRYAHLGPSQLHEAVSRLAENPVLVPTQNPALNAAVDKREQTRKVPQPYVN